jgi:DNA repair exonuclease SbcCD ATPase subunit
VYARELEVTQKEKKLAKKEEHLDQREEVITELQAKLNALNKILEEQRVQQTTVVESLQRLQQELDDRASSIALAEENLKEKDASLDKRAADLAWQEKDLAFREEMFERREKLLADHELEAEETMKKTLEDLWAKQRAGVQRIAAWAGEASTTLVPLGVSPIPVSELPTSISNALPVLDSDVDRLRRLEQILGARLEAEGGRLYRAVIEYILTCFRSHNPAISLEPMIAGPVADTEDAAWEGVQDIVDVVAERFQRDPADD